MPLCKNCQAEIRWQRGGAGWLSLNLDGTPHRPVCQAAGAARCRACEHPIVWKDHEGKRQCFEPDGLTPHNDVCAFRDRCGHCGQKVRWVLVEGKWTPFDPVLRDVIHWSVCLKNPDAARKYVQRTEAMARELEGLRRQVLELDPHAEQGLRGQVARLERELGTIHEKHARELRYRDVELARLTKIKVPV